MCYNCFMIKFPLYFRNRLITLEQGLDFINFIIKFIENYFDCKLKKYGITIDILTKLCLVLRGISDHKQSKFKCKIAIEVLTEVAKFRSNNEKELKDILEAASICKVILDLYNN